MTGTEPPPTQRAVAYGESRRVPLLKWVFLPTRLAFKLWFAGVFLTTLAVMYVPFRVLLRKPEGYPMAFRLKRGFTFFVQWAGLVPLRTLREAPLPAPPYVICCNHSSYLDIVQMYNVVPRYFLFMGKHELLKWPMLNIFFKDMDIAVDRSDRTSAAKAFRRAAQAIDRGTSIAIFPEGTIPRTVPRMKPFKDGAFRLAIEKQVPILPITFLDHWRLLGDPGDPTSRARPGIARAVVHPPIHTKGLTLADLADLRQRVFEVIEEPLLDRWTEAAKQRTGLPTGHPDHPTTAP